MRAVLDPSVLIAAVLSRTGAPASLLRAWLDGRFELVVSGALLDELDRALRYPRLRARISDEQRTALIELLEASGKMAADPQDRAAVSVDPGDDYLVALARAQRAVLVSGDRHLLDLAPDLPVLSARAFLESLPE